MSRRSAKKPSATRTLDNEQMQVVDHGAGPACVVATAGSGKTTALVERTARLIESGVPRDRILIISFSSAAKKEMEARLSARLPGNDFSKTCRTFHSLALEIFRSEVAKDVRWEVDASGDMAKEAAEMAIQSSFGSLVHNEDMIGLVREFSSDMKSRSLVERPSLRKMGLIGEELLAYATSYIGGVRGRGIYGLHAEDLVSIMYEAEDIRRGEHPSLRMSHRFVNYDDMLLHAVESLSHGGARYRWSSKWSYVMQDEAQDQSPIQSEMASLICSEHSNYMIVGDPAQSIFGFRCSSPEIMRSFADQWHGAKVFRLSKNYRSGKSIVSAANGVLRGMKDKLVSAEIVAVKSHRSSVECASFNWNTDEAVAISENLLAHHAEGFSWKDQAVLFRSRWQSEEVQKALEKANVPYRAVGEDSSQKVWPAGSRTSDRVTLSTIHAAKGREWKVVYLLGCSENLFPLDRGSVDEDRRLFYVAVTRATDELWISSSSHSASRFISESGISCHGWDPIGPRTDPNAVVGEQLSLI